MNGVLVPYPKGNYSFLRGIAPYSAGARADAGYEVVHVRLQRPIALNAGFTLVKQHLAANGRPVNALCGMELRSPRPFTFQGFSDTQTWICTIAMLLGRLEIFSVLVLFTPAFWRK